MSPAKATILLRFLLSLSAVIPLAQAHGADTSETDGSSMQQVSPASEFAPALPPSTAISGISAPESPTAPIAHDLFDEAPELPDAPDHYHTKSKLSVYFAADSAELTDVAWVTIAANANRLAEDPAASVTLIGYIDDLSSSSYGIALAQRRIQVVTDAMRSMGVALRRIRTAAYYLEEAGTVPCTTEICRASYRRVEFRFLKSRERRPPGSSASQSRREPRRRSAR
jgi:outer membrane protein OmpA-like peptidoglycan-associated protein